MTALVPTLMGELYRGSVGGRYNYFIRANFCFLNQKINKFLVICSSSSSV